MWRSSFLRFRLKLGIIAINIFTHDFQKVGHKQTRILISKNQDSLHAETIYINPSEDVDINPF
jgi:hypothetical protein